MGFNKTAKTISLVLVLGLVAAVGMYFRMEKAGHASGSSIVQAPTIAPSVAPTLTPALTSTSYLWFAALNTVYKGNADEGGIHWNANLKGHDPKLQGWLDQEVGTGSPTTTKFTLTILGRISRTEAGVPKEYLLTQVNDECNSMACGAILGGAVLSFVNSQWQIDSVEQYIAWGGWAGHFWEPPTIINIGNNSVAFLLDNKDIGTGFYSGTHTVYAYVNGAFRNVLEGGFSDNRDSFHIERLASPDKSSQSAFSSDTTFETIPTSKGLYNIRMARTDTRYAALWNKTSYGGNWKVAHITRRIGIYSFNGNIYVLKSVTNVSTNLQK